MSKISDPQYWRHRAEEARTFSDALTDPDAKGKMLKIAEDYEKLSIRALQRLRASAAIIRPVHRTGVQAHHPDDPSEFANSYRPPQARKNGRRHARDGHRETRADWS